MSILSKSNTGIKNPIEITWPWAGRKFTTYVKKVYVRSNGENTSFQIDVNEIIRFQENTITLQVCLESNLRDYIHYILSQYCDISHIHLEGRMLNGDMVINFDGLMVTLFDEKDGFARLCNSSRTYNHVTQQYFDRKAQEIMLIPTNRIDVNN